MLGHKCRKSRGHRSRALIDEQGLLQYLIYDEEAFLLLLALLLLLLLHKDVYQS